ncbi:DNA-processing protein DprA [uncultured Pelagimonas sp.]|uniref:DNA-processing protein DprA n=1 Tax=uncultured Pelagimonas sp. TaxID=1618102 RepID=UPI0026100004|nr:DNA-processing protein DprA [uncultured Pelagimonas sp.]
MRDHSYSSTHPPLPPTTEDDRVSWLRLLRSRRVGVSTFWRLLSEHGDAQTALDALPDVARSAGVQRYEACPEGVVLAELKAARARGAKLVCHGDPFYPIELAALSDAPPMLWVVGDPAALKRPMVALVGARNASSLGLRMARSLAGGLAQAGYQVVSGLARGIDTAAHVETVETGTVAVMAGGVDVLYPSENTRLAEEIAHKGGALVSEQPIGLQPMARHFPMRNRIVSGLSRAVVVVEAAAKSGSLITARYALDQGREVLAVPGHPIDARASGCNILIRDGARLVRNAEDILEALPPREPDVQPDLPGFEEPAGNSAVTPEVPEGPPPPQRSLRETAALHLQILERLGPSPVAEDQLIRDLGATSGRVSPVLTDLELDGKVERKPGGFLTLVPDRDGTRH